jgi:hypothetical protein
MPQLDPKIYGIEAFVANGMFDDSDNGAHFQILDSGGVAFSYDSNNNILVDLPNTTQGNTSAYVDIALTNICGSEMKNVRVIPTYNANDSESPQASSYIEFSATPLDTGSWTSEEVVDLESTLANGITTHLYVRQSPPSGAASGIKTVAFDLEYDVDLG